MLATSKLYRTGLAVSMHLGESVSIPAGEWDWSKYCDFICVTIALLLN